MPKIIKPVTAVQVARLKKPGMHAVGGTPGLYLKISETGGRSWVLRSTVEGKRVDRGLGSESLVGLAEARDKAREGIKKLRAGQELRPKREAVTTFAMAAKATHAAKLSGWTSTKAAKQWLMRLETYAFPILGKMDVAKIETRHIVQVLEPHWIATTPTMKNVLAGMTATMDWAKAKGKRSGDNPCGWEILQHLLPAVQTKTSHHSALPWAEVPALMAKLAELPGQAPLALRFLILNATRSAEVRGLPRTGEIEGDLWAIPGERTKSGRPHEYPLSTASLEIVLEAEGRLEDRTDKLLFPSSLIGKRQTDVVLTRTLRDLGLPAEKASVHGFRSSFRDWAGDHGYDRDLAEAQLQHVRGDATERAYARSTLLARRRALMEAWSAFCMGQEAEGNVVPMARPQVDGEAA